MRLHGKIKSIIQKEYTHDSALKSTKKYYFNNYGFIDSTIIIYGKRIFKTELFYGKKDRISKQIIESDGISLKQKYFHIGTNVDSLVNIGSKGKVNAVGNIYYNEKMKPVKTVSFSPDGDTLYTEKTSYDNQGNAVEIRFDSRDTLFGHSSISKFFYDSVGNLNRYSVFKNGKEDIDETYHYKFDKMNNWTIKTVYDSIGKLKETIKREITYK